MRVTFMRRDSLFEADRPARSRRRLARIASLGSVTDGGATGTATHANSPDRSSSPAWRSPRVRRRRGAPAAHVASSAKPSAYGTVLYDGRGYALDLFTRDGKGRSKCYGALRPCLAALHRQGKPRAGAGTKRSLVGSVRRRDGRRQVTYARTAALLLRRRRRNQIRCQNVVEFGGTWLVVAPSGLAVR